MVLKLLLRNRGGILSISMVVNYSESNYPRKASNRNVLGARKPWLEREAVHLTVEYFITLRKLVLAFSPSPGP